MPNQSYFIKWKRLLLPVHLTDFGYESLIYWFENCSDSWIDLRTKCSVNRFIKRFDSNERIVSELLCFYSRFQQLIRVDEIMPQPQHKKFIQCIQRQFYRELSCIWPQLMEKWLLMKKVRYGQKSSERFDHEWSHLSRSSALNHQHHLINIFIQIRFNKRSPPQLNTTA